MSTAAKPRRDLVVRAWFRRDLSIPVGSGEGRSTTDTAIQPWRRGLVFIRKADSEQCDLKPYPGRRPLKAMEQTVHDAPDQQVSLTDPDARSPVTGRWADCSRSREFAAELNVEY
jgi:hypothetical protein